MIDTHSTQVEQNAYALDARTWLKRAHMCHLHSYIAMPKHFAGR